MTMQPYELDAWLGDTELTRDQREDFERSIDMIAARYPGIDIVSFGPTIRGAHAPGERVEIESVGKAWRLLAAILAEASSQT